jgi:MFS family permease
MAPGQAAAVEAATPGTALQERALDPDVVFEAGLPVRGRAVGVGWEGSAGRFVRYLAAFTLSVYGDWLSTVALVILLYRLSGPAAPAGYMVARVLPRLLSGGPGGALADRLPPHRLVGACAGLQGALVASIVPASRAGMLWAVYAAVALAQFGGGLARPAIGAMVPRVAPPQRLDTANALYSIGLASSIAVGPALAALLLIVLAPETLLLIDAGTFFVAAILMLTLRLRPAPAGGSRTRGVLAGIRAVWADPAMRAIAAGWVSAGLVATTASSLLVLVAQSYGSDARVGYLYAAVGVGAVLCSLAVLRVRPRRPSRDLITGFALLEVLALAILSLNVPFAAVLVLLAASGGAGMVWQTWGATDMQRRSQSAILGRVNAVMVTGASLGMLVGAVLALGLVRWMGWQHTLFTGCAVALAVLAAGVVLGPQRPAD